MHICHVCDGLYASWRVKATLRYRFKTLDRKPRPRSQSYIGPTTVGPDIIHYIYIYMKLEPHPVLSTHPPSPQHPPTNLHHHCILLPRPSIVTALYHPVPSTHTMQQSIPPPNVHLGVEYTCVSKPTLNCSKALLVAFKICEWVTDKLLLQKEVHCQTIDGF